MLSGSYQVQINGDSLLYQHSEGLKLIKVD